MTHEDMGHIAVYKMNYEPLGVAEDYEWSGKSRSELASGKRLGHKVAKGHAKLLEQWEEASRKMDPTIKDRIAVSMERLGEKRTSTIAVAKTTEVIRAVRDGMNKAAEDDAAEKSNIINMQGEELTASGRPKFARVFDRLLWDLENDRVDDDSKRLANNKPEIWESVLKAYDDKKIG